MSQEKAKRVQKRLRRDLGDRWLVVAWDPEIERFKVGQQSSVASDKIDWFYILTDGRSGYRDPEAYYEPLVRKIHSLNMNNQKMRWTPEQVEKKYREVQEHNRDKVRDDIRYRLHSEARAFYKAAEKDGMV